MNMESNVGNNGNINQEDSNINQEDRNSSQEGSQEENKENKENIERDINNILKNEENITCSFLINASNQLNVTNANHVSPVQVNALFVSVTPYYIDRFDLEGLDLDIKMDEEGTVLLNGNKFETIEIERGVRIFGVIKRG